MRRVSVMGEQMVAKWVRSTSLMAVLVGVLLSTLGVSWPAPASAATKYAAMVMDANTGRILHARHADARRYPASLTKMMTLYMVFDLIEEGRLDYNDKIRISAQAASQPPSKLGLKVGDHIRVIDAVKALVTKSANDIATAVAEHIAGSESNFARLMTRKARHLGMTATVFQNASGLPDSRQHTTARDMLTLALALQDNHPKHYRLFRTRSFRYRGKTYRNHNRLLGRFKGTDGIKTGYIRAAGFNLVSSVRRDGKHVVAAVFGGKSGRARNRVMRSLLTSGLKRASTRKTRRARPLLVAKPKAAKRPRRIVTYTPPKAAAPPAPRPVVDVARRIGRAAPAAGTRQTAAAVKVARVKPVSIFSSRQSLGGSPDIPRQRRDRAITANALAPAMTPARDRGSRDETTRRLNKEAGVRGRKPSTLQDQLAALLARSGSIETTQRQPKARRSAPDLRPTLTTSERRTTSGTHLVQVGAFVSRREAEQQLAALASRERNLLGSYQPVAQPVMTGRKQLYRARFAGFDANSASRICTELRRRSVDCFVARKN